MRDLLTKTGNGPAGPLLLFLIPFALSASTLLVFLLGNSYHFTRPEAIILLILLALLFGGAALVARPFRTVGWIVTAAALLFFIDYAAPGYQSFGMSARSPFWTFIAKDAAVLFLLILALGRLGKEGWKILATFSLVIFFVSIASGWGGAGNVQVHRDVAGAPPAIEAPPLYLHIILDEHMGLGHTPDGIETAGEAAKRMRAFYEKFGFLLFENSFSHYLMTHDSLPNAFNFAASGDKNSYVDSRFTTVAGHMNHRMAKNRIFDLLEEKGYQLRIFQTDQLDFCHSAHEAIITYCIEYASNGISPLQETPIPPLAKAKLVTTTWLNTPPLFIRLKVAFVKTTVSLFGYATHREIVRFFDGFNKARLTPVNSMMALDRLPEELGKFPAGVAFFAHLLLPHYPYIYNEQCEINPDPATWRFAYLFENEAAFDQRLWRELYTQYYRQMSCLYAKLDTLFTRLEKDGLLDKATIIMHGDHGSRNIFGKPGMRKIPEDLWDRYVKDGYSTFFAVRAPGVRPGRSTLPKPYSLLLKEFWLTPGRLRKEAPASRFLFLDNGGSTYQKTPYPF